MQSACSKLVTALILLLSLTTQANPSKLISIAPISPPPQLYHWTSLGWIEEWAKLADKDNSKLPLTSDLIGSQTGMLLQNSLQKLSSKQALFAWSHPVGGMAARSSLYPEVSHSSETYYGYMKMLGLNVKNPLIVEEFKRHASVLKPMTWAGLDPPPQNIVLLDMDVDPKAKAFGLRIEEGWGSQAERSIKELIPEIASGSAQILYVESDALREWIILDSSAIKRFNADPSQQKSFLRPIYDDLRAGKVLPEEALHISESYLKGKEGRTDALQVLDNLLNHSAEMAEKIPAFFKAPEVNLTSNSKLSCVDNFRLPAGI